MWSKSQKVVINNPKMVTILLKCVYYELWFMRGRGLSVECFSNPKYRIIDINWLPTKKKKTVSVKSYAQSNDRE